ncbi:SusD/RagB family nutrient-binding outer membrane lipoprotein [Xanthovirga aplysinae]|uniref:SusD/RagB family nutrient-binding outer membrane lipoprotein n=1 Tax=Xanthovirga aplysinae TaxID=2529853 RepID=UPI0012BBA93F|nr:SusD/RagB family nutrient-binding outer membrane lipoprotein [Xanthovirga aplysinae]MTI32031.1 SusD/RagB family nutrient-binding outer membrane lipoprotein [Xanthovirga aplysinae]
MKLLKYISRILAVYLVLVMVACETGFDDLNTNPNATESTTPESVMPYAMARVAFEVNFQIGFLTTSNWVQHIAESEYPSADQYRSMSAISNIIWDELYFGALKDFKFIEDKSFQIQTETGFNKSNYIAIAKIMKAYTYSVMTDVWGSIPYEEALEGDEEGGSLTPSYDDQETIYNSLLSELEDAVGLIVIEPDENNKPSSEDLIYGGDMGKWLKFANSLQLRMYMHLSKKMPGTYDAKINSLLEDPKALMEKNSENAQLIFSGDAANPVYSRINARPRDFRMSKTLIDMMRGGTEISPDYIDPRLPLFAKKSEEEKDADDNVIYEGGEYIGIHNGMNSIGELKDDADDPLYTMFKSSKVGDAQGSANSPAILMTYSEVLFIKAELAAKNGSAEAQELYENAVKASMEQFGVEDQAAIDNFLDHPNFNYEQAEKPLQLIGEQKWVALYGNWVEAFSNWRRTGFPELQAASTNFTSGVIPRRFTYPTLENSTNGSNYSSAISAQGGADLIDRVWWDAE